MKPLHTIAIIPLLFLFACGGGNPDDGSFNVFSKEQDVAFGKQLREQMMAENTVWERGEHAEAYALLDSISAEIRKSDKLYYKDFPWEIYIVEDDNVANAFCGPGGYIFIYTGIMKYIYTTDELAGVMAHEIAHADRRHSTDQLTKEYGISLLLYSIFGSDGNAVGDLASSLFSLGYSRQNEKEADEYGVTYLCGTGFEADASKRFFKRLAEDETIEIPAFISTHPNHDSRIQELEAKAAELDCKTGNTEKPEVDQRLRALFLVEN